MRSKSNFLRFPGFLLLMGIASCTNPYSQKDLPDSKSKEVYQFDENSATRWSSFENIEAKKGKAAILNKGAKGSSNKPVKAGESVVLLDENGPGMINRMWLTHSHWQRDMYRNLKLRIYWDNAEDPAVSVPLGDFFCKGAGRKTMPFENIYFSDPEGKSYNCAIPMPFKSAAKVVLINDSDEDLSYLFYDINFELLDELPADAMYFHAYWHRDTLTRLGEDFEILPNIQGKGRFLGCNITINANPVYGDLWWGEGEVKIYLDGDTDYPTLAGSGTEDYIGTAWGQGVFDHTYQGCLVADKQNLTWSFYRFHVPDPVWFRKDIKVTIQQMGGGPLEEVLPLLKQDIPITPVAVDLNGWDQINLLDLEETPDQILDTIPDGGIRFYRSDDVAATAYFYLDKPSNTLPEIQDLSIRLK